MCMSVPTKPLGIFTFLFQLCGTVSFANERLADFRLHNANDNSYDKQTVIRVKTIGIFCADF